LRCLPRRRLQTASGDLNKEIKEDENSEMGIYWDEHWSWWKTTTKQWQTWYDSKRIFAQGNINIQKRQDAASAKTPKGGG